MSAENTKEADKEFNKVLIPLVFQSCKVDYTPSLLPVAPLFPWLGSHIVMCNTIRAGELLESASGTKEDRGILLGQGKPIDH